MALKLILVLFVWQALGQTTEFEQVPPQVSRKEILASLKELKIDDLELFTSSILEIRKNSEKYIEYKQSECSGKFASIQIGTEGLEEQPKKELTKEEKEACYLELKNFEAKFTNEVFKNRKKFIQKLHHNQLVDLEKTRTEILVSLEKTYNKTLKNLNRRGKRRRKK